MRKLTAALFMVCLGASVALAQGKIDSSFKCDKGTDVQSLNVTDSPGRSFALDHGKCTATKGEIAGVKEKEGIATEMMDSTATGFKNHGHFSETLANGDKVHYEYSGSGTTKNNNFVSGTNKWTITGGTGKAKGIKGSGGCKGTGNPDGSANWDCTGTYTMGK
jgi:hypothetical protein